MLTTAVSNNLAESRTNKFMFTRRLSWPPFPLWIAPALIIPAGKEGISWVVWALAVVLHWPILDDFTSFSSATRPSV